MWPFRKKRADRLTRDIDQLCIRRADGSLWVPWHCQNFGLSMLGLFERAGTDRKRGNWFFCRARWHKGKLIVARRIWWLPKPGEWDLQPRAGIKGAVILPPMPEPRESDLFWQRREAA